MFSVFKQPLGQNGRLFLTSSALLSVAFLAACNNTKIPNISSVPTPQAANQHRIALAGIDSGNVEINSFGNQVERLDNIGQDVVKSIPVARPDVQVQTPQQLASLKANTSNKTKFSSKTFGVAGSPRVTNRVSVRKGGGRYQIGKPYSIRGIKYYPKLDPNLKQTGLASWYGPNFHGRLTANGEVYDQYGLSAAHPTMPLPSYAKVTNLENGSSITVRVNDRGPFSKSRVIDLSARAAQLLGYTKQGVAKVRVEYAGKAPLHGLDEKKLIATYKPGSVNQASIPALPGQTAGLIRKTPQVTQVASNQRIETVTISKKNSNLTPSLKSAVTSRINVAHDNVPRPKSLVNGYVGSADKNTNIQKAFQYIDGESRLQEPQLGMKNLVQLKFGPFKNSSEIKNAEKFFSDYGIVQHLSSEASQDKVLLLITAEESVVKILNAVKIADISLYSAN